MEKNCKKIYKKSIRVDGRLKSIIEKNFRDVSQRTGLKLSYGKIARAFWSTLASDARVREKCMKLVCKTLLEESRRSKKNTKND